MDSVIERLSNLESIWRITSEEIVNLIANKTEENEINEEFDIFKYKTLETRRITDVIDELILESEGKREQFLENITELIVKIEEEVKEIGVPLVLPSLQVNFNLPRQFAVFQNLWNDLQRIKSEMIEEKENLFKSAAGMYREEQESSDCASALPNWIHELFNCTVDSSLNNSVNEDSSFNTLAISHLDAAINELDPFHPSLSGSLAKIEAAHEILKGRLELFKAEYEALWIELETLNKKLFPFEFDEISLIKSESDSITEMLSKNCSINTPTRSTLRKVLIEWKRIEKERNETISGSILLIGRLWNLLETPIEERFDLCPADLSLKNMKQLSQERHRLINFQQQKFKELYDSQVLELEKLMAALKWNQNKKELVLSNCQSYTADGLQYLSRQLAILQPKLEMSVQLISTIDSRYALIDKMREFEKSASDPARLFRSSFQLLQEEKFRKTALPSLLNLETQIKSQLLDYKMKFEEDFEYKDFVYLDLLEEEISNRFMSSGIFGFDQGKQRKERQSSIPSVSGASTTSNTPRYLQQQQQQQQQQREEDKDKDELLHKQQEQQRNCSSPICENIGSFTGNSSVNNHFIKLDPCNRAPPDGPAFFFDLDNTLYPKSSGIAELMAQRIELFFVNYLKLPLAESKLLGARFYRDYGLAIKGLIKHFAIDPMEYDKFVDGGLPLDEILQPQEHLTTLLDSLSRRGTCWIFTNAGKSHAKRVLNLLQIESFFSGIIHCDYSETDFPAKPDRLAFARAMQCAHIDDPQKCFFFDDSIGNIQAAQEIGWKVVYIDEDADSKTLAASKDQINATLEIITTDPQDGANSLETVPTIKYIEDVEQVLHKLLQ